jgi:hypothetical protein
MHLLRNRHRDFRHPVFLSGTTSGRAADQGHSSASQADVRSTGRHRFPPATRREPKYPYPGGMFPRLAWRGTSGEFNCLEKFCNVVLRRPQLSSRIIIQVHSHGQTVEWGLAHLAEAVPQRSLLVISNAAFHSVSPPALLIASPAGSQESDRFNVGSLFPGELLGFFSFSRSIPLVAGTAP